MELIANIVMESKADPAVASRPFPLVKSISPTQNPCPYSLPKLQPISAKEFWPKLAGRKAGWERAGFGGNRINRYPRSDWMQNWGEGGLKWRLAKDFTGILGCKCWVRWSYEQSLLDEINWSFHGYI